MVYEVLVAIARPVVVIEYVSGTIVVGFNIPIATEGLRFACLCILFVALLSLVYCDTAKFVFRFGQTLNSDYVEYLSRPRHAVAIGVLCVALFGAATILPWQYGLVSEDIIRERMSIASPKTLADIGNLPIVALSVSRQLLPLSMLRNPALDQHKFWPFPNNT